MSESLPPAPLGSRRQLEELVREAVLKWKADTQVWFQLPPPETYPHSSYRKAHITGLHTLWHGESAAEVGTIRHEVFHRETFACPGGELGKVWVKHEG